MVPNLRLTLTDYAAPTRWRWVLADAQGKFLADHDVRLDASTREYQGFLDLARYLDYHQPIHPVEKQLAELGGWIGQQVFGGLREALWQRRALPAVAVHVAVPAAAQELLFRPFELAQFATGKSFREAGLRFVYQLDGGATPAAAKTAEREEEKEREKTLRVLAAFSLPVKLNPLNLRRERYELQRLVRELNLTHGTAASCGCCNTAPRGTPCKRPWKRPRAGTWSICPGMASGANCCSTTIVAAPTRSTPATWASCSNGPADG